MAQLAIVGHNTRGNEVLRILEMLGGVNHYKETGSNVAAVYFITNRGNIFSDHQASLYEIISFTLEEFLEKYPYKIGDKVYNIIHNENQIITKISWDSLENELAYQTNNNEYVYVNYLQPYKEEIMEEKLMPRIDFTEYCKDKYIIDLGNYEIKKENDKTYAVRKQSKYPKTYEECLEILGYNIAHTIPMNHGHNGSLMMKFQRLLIYRDAYWKIAGDEMRLGKSWEPDWLNKEQDKFVLYTHDNVICSNCFILGHNVLAFPTKEMRDTFYGNFKELIEQCKELL